MYISHKERHKTQRIGWLRAAVLGANDGIVFTASLVVRVAASDATHESVLVAGVAALAAGAALPLLTAVVVPVSAAVPVVSGTSLVFLAELGALAAHTGGAPIFRGAARVTFWGALAMDITAVVGSLFGAAV